MDPIRYKFAKETEPQLLEFIKVARETKFKNCDLEEYKVWSQLLPPDPHLLSKLDEISDKKLPTIDLTSPKEPRTLVVEETVANEIFNKSSAKDIVFAIKENLDTLNTLAVSTRDDLVSCDCLELEELFLKLDEVLKSEEIYHLGVSIQDCDSEELIARFCHDLLLPRIKTEYCDDLGTLLLEYSSKHPSVLKTELLSHFSRITGNEVKILTQYLKKINPEYKCLLFRDFIFNVDSLNENYLLIVENLINDKVEYEVYNKLVELLSNVAEEYCKDKVFGKLLMNIIQFLGANVVNLEQPLKHLIAGHQSVWKSKLEKSFNTYEDTMFTQSFRDKE